MGNRYLTNSLIVSFFCFFTLYSKGQDISLLQVTKTGLPIVYITTETGEKPTFRIAYKDNPDYIGNTITDEEKLPGRVFIQYNGDTIFDSHEYIKDSLGMTIKVRGNTSALLSKKWPYKIKLQKKADMLCRGNDSIYKDKNWILIRDENIRNMIGFKVNELMGIQWTPAFKYVNVVMNGVYEGVYMLMESMNRNVKCRIDVDKNGFLGEFDPYWWNENFYIPSTLTWLPWLYMNYTFKYPDAEEITEDQIAYITEYLRKTEESLTDGTYRDFIDVESFARWMLARDILGNSDGAGSNIYFTKYDDTPDSKLKMANLWDLEGSMRNNNTWDAVHKMGIFYFHDLFDNENEEFIKKYKKIWETESSTIFHEILTFLESYEQSEEAIALNKSIDLDNLRWDNDNSPIPQCISDAKAWFTDRKKWLSEAIANIKTEEEIIEHEKYNIYYTLKGYQVKPKKRGVYIRKGYGGNTQKIIIIP